MEKFGNFLPNFRIAHHTSTMPTFALQWINSQDGLGVQFNWNRIEAFSLLPHADSGNFHFEMDSITAGWSIRSAGSLTKLMSRTIPSWPTSNVASTNPCTRASFAMGG
jgi:hypothetical protein